MTEVEVPGFKLVTNGEKGSVIEPEIEEEVNEQEDYCTLEDFFRMVEGIDKKARLVFEDEKENWNDITLVEIRRYLYDGDEPETVVMS